jgi:predicted methyltransferase
MKALWTGAAIAALIATGAAAGSHSPGQTKAAVAKALADPARADQAGDDARRHAAEVLEFAGVGPGDRVVDLVPGGGYWTRILTNVVGPKGQIIAMWPGRFAKYSAKALPALRARGLANVRYDARAELPATVPAPVDLVWTVQNYHDFANDGGGITALAALDASVFKMLKRGGSYVVIDHVDVAGAPLADGEAKHRIDPALVKAQVVKAGFVFVGESTVLRNPADDHTLKVFDPAIRGHTDQFVYKFRKP